jgi:hypothetical protein
MARSAAAGRVLCRSDSAPGAAWTANAIVHGVCCSRKAAIATSRRAPSRRSGTVACGLVPVDLCLGPPRLRIDERLTLVTVRRLGMAVVGSRHERGMWCWPCRPLSGRQVPSARAMARGCADRGRVEPRQPRRRLALGLRGTRIALAPNVLIAGVTMAGTAGSITSGHTLARLLRLSIGGSLGAAVIVSIGVMRSSVTLATPRAGRWHGSASRTVGDGFVARSGAASDRAVAQQRRDLSPRRDRRHPAIDDNGPGRGILAPVRRRRISGRPARRRVGGGPRPARRGAHLVCLGGAMLAGGRARPRHRCARRRAHASSPSDSLT